MLFDEALQATISSARADTLGEHLRRSAARRPHKTALIDGDTTLTFAELDRLANRFANALAECGVQPGERIALLSRNCWQFAVTAYGAARAGAILVPLNFVLTAGEIGPLLDVAQPKILIAQTELVETGEAAVSKSGWAVATLVEITAEAAVAPAPGWIPFDEILATSRDEAPAPVVGADDPIRIMFTSGTESRPKGAVHSSRSLGSEYLSSVVEGGMDGDDIDLHALPLYHCAQLDCFLGPDIMLGVTSILLPAPDPATILRKIAEHRVTKFFAPPTVWISLLRSPEFDDADLSSLKKGYYGAAAMPVEVLLELQRRLPNLQLWNFYGQTELAPVATILPPHEQLSHAGSAGRPVLHVETRVVDEHGEPVPVGEVGEIVHRSPQLALGYWNAPEQTAEAFRGGWFHSGDLGVFDEDGRLRIVDRSKDMINTGGENVASREVEEALYEHAAIAECAVFATPHPKWVETVTAAVVLTAGATATEEELRAHTRERLAAFKVPTVVHVVATLPKNPSGKILKRELRERFAEDSPVSF
ncbi:fatty acyl-CoA synthetase [Leucobacter aridicollis]|uniref:Fatty-acyl-CoA synthase n=1 Tax=Leucobacter aridicollis TaxID=283878 RepID=A0A852RA08_9MICO|nr:fatty acyl-CoA synthetase [Leucobacter aridicollis]MBL3683469.1 acyl-CoA synthetase [Leucobacter aridicollis]NYD25224.1 fatty-acyl-CoA synthase [Leucobacter aridicollis]